MTTEEFEAQMEANFNDNRKAQELHEDFQLKHNDFMDMGDISGQPDIPEPISNERAHVDYITGKNRPEPPHNDIEKHIKRPNSPYQGDPFAENEEMYVKPSQSTEKSDIEKPSHYNICGCDSMPMIEKILGTEAYLGFLCGNVWKYRIRVGKKQGAGILSDIKKAMYYEKLYNTFVEENTP